MSRGHHAAGEPSAPSIPRRLEPIGDAEFLRRREWEDVLLEQPDLALAEARGVRLQGVRFDGGDIGEAQLAALSLEDCELLRGSAANVRAHGASLRRVVLQGVRLTGARFDQAELRDLRLDGCGADLASLQRADVVDTIFSDCGLRDLDLRGARLERVAFERCDLTGADFEGARFRDCVMRGCTLTGAQGIASLRGVGMPLADVIEHAVTFAGALGITRID